MEGLGPHVFACLGGWGSGKTVVGAAATAMRLMSLRGDVDGYRPQAAVFGPTFRVVEKVLMPKLAAAIPRGVIAKKVGRPFPTWKLINGVDVSFVSGESTFEGEDLAHIWIDEVQTLAADPGRFQNYMARLRDVRAGSLSLVATGLPESGWVRDTFDPELARKAVQDLRSTVLMGTRDNPHLPPDLFEQYLASCPSGYEEAFIQGGWMPTENAMYPAFSDDNLVDESWYDSQAPVSLGLDAGVSSAIVVGQPCPIGDKQGVVIVGNEIGGSASVEEMCERAAARFGHQIVPGHSTICTDPTLRADEVRAIRRVFPRVRILIRPRSDPFYSVKPGIRLVQAAIRNAKGDRHLRVLRSLRTVRNGTVQAFQQIKRSPRTGERIKDDVYDHVDDACRYLLNHMLGDRGFAPEVQGR